MSKLIFSMLNIKKTFFNRVIIHGFIHTIIYVDKKHKHIKLIISNNINDTNAEYAIETLIFKKNLIESCDKWYKIGASIIVDANIVVFLTKSNESKNMSLKKQIIRIEKITTLVDGVEYY